MNLVDLEALFRDQTDDEKEPYFTSPAKFLIYLNEAQRRAVRNANLILDKSSSFTQITTSPSNNDYPLDPLIYSVIDVFLNTDDNPKMLYRIDYQELDRRFPEWKTETPYKPTHYIQHDKTLEFYPRPDDIYQMQMTVYRYPETVDENTTELEISDEHHERLLEWCMYRTYSKPDADIFNPGKAELHKQEFYRYFGQEPRAITRKLDQYSNRPHRNKVSI